MTVEADNNIDVLIELAARHCPDRPSPRSTQRHVGASVSAEEAEALKPAVSIRKSVTPDYIICLEDGKKFKSLKRP